MDLLMKLLSLLFGRGSTPKVTPVVTPQAPVVPAPLSPEPVVDPNQLSKHFTLSEMTRSDYALRNGLDNTPPPELRANLVRGCRDVLDVIEDKLGKPLIVHSGYRSPKVNAGIGGAKNSQHMTCEACDFTVKGVSVAELFEIVRGLGVPFDQIIEEFGSWVHISWGTSWRKECLVARKVDGKTQYTRV